MGVVLHDVGSWIRRRKVFAALILALTLGVVAIIGAALSGPGAATLPGDPFNAEALPVPNPVHLSSTFAAIVARVQPAVVNISTAQLIAPPRDRRHYVPNDPFGDFLNHFFGHPDQPEAERDLGSGIIIDPRGYILTNRHVIEGATRIEVSLAGDPTRYVGRLVGQDSQTDLAVVKINAGRPLPVVHMGNSRSVQVGDWVLAFGSPFALQGTVTSGIVSAMNRSSVGLQLQHFIQTDAAINPGNSGGPLVNMAGQVIGINTAIYTGGRSFEGVGFAVPSNTAINVYNQLVHTGHVTRGSIGVSFQSQRSQNPIALKMLGAPYGIIIERVNPGGPAAKAGIRAGDVIVSVNGKPVRNTDDLVNPIIGTAIGQSVMIGFIRNGKQHETPVRVASRDRLFPTTGMADDPVPGQPVSERAINRNLGLRIDTLTAKLAGQLKIRDLAHGVIVREVEPTSFADETGFIQGDVIVAVNHVAVYTVRDFHHELAKIRPGQDVLFKVLRRQDDETYTVFLAGVMPEGK